MYEKMTTAIDKTVEIRILFFDSSNKDFLVLFF